MPMIRIVQLLAVVWLLVGCGENGLVYITRVLPALINTADGSGAPSESYLISPTVDTSRNWCVDIEDNDKCFKEPFSAHWALIEVANDREPDPENPMLGRESFRSYTLELIAEEEGTPKLIGHTGVLRGVLAAGDTEAFQTVLVDFSNRSRYNAAGVGRPTRYTARYRIMATSGLELRGATTILIGSFDFCPPKSYGVSVCPFNYAP